VTNAILFLSLYPSSTLQLSSNRDFDLDTSLNVDDDLLDNLGRSVKTARIISTYPYLPSAIFNLLNQTLVNSHLESIPGLGTFTTGCLSGGDLQGLGRETDWALDTELLALGTLDELLADLLEGLDFAGGQGDADLVSFLRIFRSADILGGRKGRAYGALAELLFWLLVRHFAGRFPSRLERFSYGKVMKVIVVGCVVDGGTRDVVEN
jgi:hypothetical protein